MIGDVAVGLAAGGVAGAVFFGGLHWTVNRLVTTRHPIVLTVFSFVVRGMALAATVILVSGGRTVRVLAALVGILAVRTLLVGRVRRQGVTEEAPWI